MTRTPACEDSGIGERMRELQRDRMAAIAGCSCPQRTTAGEVVHRPGCAMLPPPPDVAIALAVAMERLRARRKHRTLPSADELMAEAVAAKYARHLTFWRAIGDPIPWAPTVDDAKMKRRALEARRFGGECDDEASQALAEDYRDPNRQGQDRPLISEDGQLVSGRVGLPRSRP